MDLEAIPCWLEGSSVSQSGGVSPKSLSAQGTCEAVCLTRLWQVGWECWACPGGLDREHLALLLSPQSVFALEKVLLGPSFITTCGTSPHKGLLLSAAALRLQKYEQPGVTNVFSQNINFI